MSLISIITPCFNHGIYLDDAFNSIQLDKHAHLFEHIIVNDGSTDAFTLAKLDELEAKGSIVIHQQNKGLAAARNRGIEMAAGKYILPLDSDNKIIPDVFIKAAGLMEQQPIAAVYTDAIYFGEKNELWKTGGFDPLKLLNGNYIDACALLRKETVIQAGGYDGAMPFMGNEDWELWINLLSRKETIYYLEMPGFYYRVLPVSMMTEHTMPGQMENRNYVFKKHSQFVIDSYGELMYQSLTRLQKLEQLKEQLYKRRFFSAAKILLGRKFY